MQFSSFNILESILKFPKTKSDFNEIDMLADT